ncbi:hypothetical protein LguiA_011848 [Lonicera macranthoides]
MMMINYQVALDDCTCCLSNGTSKPSLVNIVCCLQHVDQELVISIPRLLKHFLFIDVCCVFARVYNFKHQLLFEKNAKRRIILYA